MKVSLLKLALIVYMLAVSVGFLHAQTPSFVYGDALPDAPALAARGQYAEGVKTLELLNPGQVSFSSESEVSDRAITVEIWYPAEQGGADQSIVYKDVMGVKGDPNRPIMPMEFAGRAVRDVALRVGDAPYPLVIVSHGFLGSRYLMTYLTENLASKGYVVAAIDHPQSTFTDPGPFASTLYFRALDDIFVLNQLEKLSAKDSKSFLEGKVDTKRTALIGYSMGGYGVLNAIGAGYSEGLGKTFAQLSRKEGIFDDRVATSPSYKSLADSRVKAAVVFAPWGMQRGAWDKTGLDGITIPILIVAGDKDDISEWENGVKAIYDGINNAEKYMLVYKGARHNVAPNPPPVEAFDDGINPEEYMRYAEPVWDERRINNINQHFITAFLGLHLLGNAKFGKYLEISLDAESETWNGFRPRTSLGLELHRAKPGL